MGRAFSDEFDKQTQLDFYWMGFIFTIFILEEVLSIKSIRNTFFY